MTYESIYASSNKDTAGGAGASASGDMPQNWQTVYTYAQQLYDAGHIRQAEEYHAYAQQLYDAEQQRLSTAPPAAHTAGHTVSMTPVRYESNVPPPASASPSDGKPPSWQVLYNYAQELYSAGNLRQAEQYYNQAQLLYAEANPTANALPPQPTADIATSQPSNAWSTSTAVTETPSWNTDPSLDASSTNDWSAPSAAYSETSNETVVIARPQPDRPRPRRKRNIKRWVTITVLITLGITAGAYIGLFYRYKKQLRQKASDTYYYDATWSKIEGMTIQPVINILSPAFDKTIRLGVAAQPLLYELHLRSTPPQPTAEMVKTQTPQAAGVIAAPLRAPMSNDSASNAQKETPSAAINKTDSVSATTDIHEESPADNTSLSTASPDDAPVPTPNNAAPPTPDASLSPDPENSAAPANTPAAEPVIASVASSNSPPSVRTAEPQKRSKRLKRASRKKKRRLSKDPLSGMDF